MNPLILQQSGQLYYTTQKVAEILGVSEASARVLCARYVKNSFLTRLKNNFYLITGRIPSLTLEEMFYLSNIIETPSYISLTSALAYYGLTTQLPQGSVEAVSPAHSRSFLPGPLFFVYSKITPRLYGGFVKKDTFFIATPEKALLDAIYLTSLSRYALDTSAIDRKAFSVKRLRELARQYPPRAKEALNKFLNP